MRVIPICIALTLLYLVPAWGAEVLVLQSNRSSGYSDAMCGFHAAFKGSQRTVVLSDFAETDVERIVREERPRLVLAVGDRALSAARKLRDLPVVTMLTLAHSCRNPLPDHIGGVAMLPAPEQYMKLFVSMGVRKFGVLYDPAKTGRYLKRIEHEARQLGLHLVAEPVSDSRDIQARLEKIKGSVEALWMLPDSTVSTTINLEAFILFSMANKVPVVTFSSYYLKNGAAASVDIDYFDIGLQTGELTSSLLNSGVLRKVPTVDPRKTVLRINETVVRKLGLQLP